VAKLKKVEQEERTIKEFVQKFKRTARGSRYKIKKEHWWRSSKER